MSRVGNAPVSVPAGVDVTISGVDLKVKGPKGELEMTIPEPIAIKQDGDELVLERPNDDRESKARHGLARSLVNNMVIGVSEGYRKDLEIIGVGYRAAAKGKNALEMQLGFSHPVNYQAPDGIEFDVPEQTKIGVIGIDKQVVGQVAAEIRAFKKPEPYKGKGIRYVGEHVIRKAGKAAK